MTTICWTVIHRATTPVARVVARFGHAARHAIRPVAYRAARMPNDAAAAAGPARTWVEVVCKIVPAALVGGGLLAPYPVNPPRLPAPPAPIVQPAPPTSPWLFPPGTHTAPATPVQPYPTPVPVEPTGPVPVGPPSVGPTSPPVEAVPEPSSAGLLLGGAAVLLVIRAATRRTRPHTAGSAGSAGGGEPGPRQTHLIRRGPVL